MDKNSKHSPHIKTMQPLKYDNPDAAHYSALATAIISYIHTGNFDFPLVENIKGIADISNQSLEKDWCTDEAINEALNFVMNCNDAALNNEHYEQAIMQKEEVKSLELDRFSYYLLTLKKMPSSPNLIQFQRHQYVAIYIIASIIEHGKQMHYNAETDAQDKEWLLLLTKLYSSFSLLRDRETNNNTESKPSEKLADSLAKDLAIRGSQEEFSNRIFAAVEVIYKENAKRFSTLNDMEIAKYISENDKFLDYYFHSSTPKSTSISSQQELNDKGYFSFVLESIQKIKS
jgi:hypothetical protein